MKKKILFLFYNVTLICVKEFPIKPVKKVIVLCQNYTLTSEGKKFNTLMKEIYKSKHDKNINILKIKNNVYKKRNELTHGEIKLLYEHAIKYNKYSFYVLLGIIKNSNNILNQASERSIRSAYEITKQFSCKISFEDFKEKFVKEYREKYKQEKNTKKLNVS
jgi:hypothetical protein